MQPTSSFKVRITKNYSDSDKEKYSEWVHSVNATLDLLRRRPRDSSTYRVPTKLRATLPPAYTPQVVCIGPFHLNKPELRATEELKWRYMLAYLDRVGGTDTENMQINELGGVYDENSAQTLALNKCCKVVSELEEEARAWYAEDINLDKHQLVEMLLVDACFILELFYRYNVMSIKKFHEQHIPSIHEDQVPFESLPSNYTMMNTLTYDLLRLENQIPYIILQKLFDVIPAGSKRISIGTQALSLRQHVLCFFHRIPMLRINVLELDSYINDATFSHLLDVLCQVCNLTSWVLPLQLTYGKWGFERGASELTKAGFKIICRNRSDSMSIVDIGFHEGTISIPSIFIDKRTVTLLRNLIALEQTRSGGQVITSYVILMSTLIGSEEDANLLKRLGILQNPENRTNLSGFFKSLCNEIYSERFYFKDLCEEVENYQIRLWSWYRMKGYLSITWLRWNKSIKDLKRDYFKNRWSFIAFLTGSFVILLTLLQTLYTIRAYYPPYH